MKQLAVLVVFGLLAVGCGGTATVTDTDIAATEADVVESAAEQQVEPTAVPAEPTAVPASSVPEPTAPPAPTATPEPAPTAEPALAGWSDELRVGSCFNDRGTSSVEPIDCNDEHENELFLLTELPDGPDAPYRSGGDFLDEIFETICDDATQEFAGAPWDLLPLRTAVWAPSEAQWEAGDRTIGCSAQSGLADRPLKIGTAVGGNLTSDEGIVSRASVDGQSDYFFSFQASTLYRLTDGEFELPPTSPQVVSSGFQFGSPSQGDTSGAQAWSYLFDSMESAGLETALPDSWEIASVHFVVEIPAFLFAARQDESDDWEIYLHSTENGSVQLTDNSFDDQFPTLTTDESQILWSAGGNVSIMDLDGNNRVELTSGPGAAFESHMSPDGSTILFTSNASGNEDVWSMNADGSNQVNLTNHPAIDSWPFFSEDGSIIYFQTDRVGVNAIIMMMELDGSNQSYFSFEFMTNAALLPDSLTSRFKNELTAIGEEPDNSNEPEEDDGAVTESDIVVVQGSPDELNEVEHSEGRIITALPGDWEYRESSGDNVLSLVAAPSLSEFATRWDFPGVTYTIFDLPNPDGVIDIMDVAPAADDSGCEQDSESSEVDGELTTTIRRYTCGSQGQAVVVGIFDADDETGLVFEGQWADDADGEANADLIEAIGDATRWG